MKIIKELEIDIEIICECGCDLHAKEDRKNSDLWIIESCPACIKEKDDKIKKLEEEIQKFAEMVE